MKKITITFLTIALVAMGAVFVIGQAGSTDKPEWNGEKGKHHRSGRGFGGRRGGKGHNGRMFRGLDLTDDQKAQMKTIRQSSRENMKPIHEQMRTNKEQLDQLSANGAFDVNAVQAVAAQQGALTAQMIVEKERTKAAIFAILTADQKATLAVKKQERAAKMAERKAKRAEWKAAREAKKAAETKSN